MRWRSILWLEFCCLSATCILPQLFNKIINFHWKVFASLRKSIEIPIWLRIQIDSAGISANTMNCSDCSLEAIMTAIRFPFSWWSWCCCLSNLVLVLVPGFFMSKIECWATALLHPTSFFSLTKHIHIKKKNSRQWKHLNEYILVGSWRPEPTPIIALLNWKDMRDRHKESTLFSPSTESQFLIIC